MHIIMQVLILMWAWRGLRKDIGVSSISLHFTALRQGLSLNRKFPILARLTHLVNS